MRNLEELVETFDMCQKLDATVREVLARSLNNYLFLRTHFGPSTELSAEDMNRIFTRFSQDIHLILPSVPGANTYAPSRRNGPLPQSDQELTPSKSERLDFNTAQA